MLLQRLKEYADERMDMPPMLYVERPIRYLIELDSAGRLLSPTPIDTADPSAPATKRGQRILAPQVQRAVGIKPLLLADNGEYTLGLAKSEASRPDRVIAVHQAYLALVDRCADATNDPAVRAVQTFLHGDPLAQLRRPDDFDPSADITFAVDGVKVIDLPAVRAFWASLNDPGANNATVMTCLVCGQERPVLDRMQAKLKGVPGGQTAGVALISANADAFESYGLEASLIAPVCADCAERFTKAANEFLGNRAHHLTIGGAKFIFWTREDVGFNLLVLDRPTPEDVRALLDSVRSGRPTDVDSTAFYATALSGSGGRAVVRDWVDTTVGQVKGQLANWFQRQAIVDLYGDTPQPLGLYTLAAATVRDASKELSPPTVRALWRAALTDTPVPSYILSRAVQRCRAEGSVTRPRAALIKLVLSSHHPDLAEDSMTQLNLDHPSAAYQCGRLLAALEQIQRLAIPGLNATLVDRFYGTASTAPASVFGNLLGGAQAHLSKLERDNKGAWVRLQSTLEEILGHIETFPRTLTLEEQGLFALGYYHQRAADNAARAAGAQRKRAAQDDSNNGSDE